MMGGVGGFFMILFMLMLLVLAVLGIMALVRYLQLNRKPSLQIEDNALSILNERYAQGEINDEEYAAKKAALTKR